MNVWTDETLVGAGTAVIRDGAFADRSGTIAAYAYGTVMVQFDAGDQNGVALPFGLGEISEIRESKHDGLVLSKSGMKAFLKLLSDWAEVNGTAGRTIVSEPDAGPGTMHWYAR